MSNLSHTELTLALLDFVNAEEGQYQLGLTKVTCRFLFLLAEVNQVLIDVHLSARCFSRSYCTSSWKSNGTAHRPGLPSPSRGTSGGSSAGKTLNSSKIMPLSFRGTFEDTRPGVQMNSFFLRCCLSATDKWYPENQALVQTVQDD